MKRIRLLVALLVLMALALFGGAGALDHGGNASTVQPLAEIISLVALFDILSGLSLLVVRALRHKPAS
jgi:hypothetical protein